MPIDPKHLFKLSVFIEMQNKKDLTDIFTSVYEEYFTATNSFEPFNSMHEGYAVLKEEVDELWTNIKLNANKHPNRLELIRKEALQVAAMAIRIIYDSHSSELDRTKDGAISVKANEKSVDTVKFDIFTQTYCEKCENPENCSGNLVDCKQLYN